MTVIHSATIFATGLSGQQGKSQLKDILFLPNIWPSFISTRTLLCEIGICELRPTQNDISFQKFLPFALSHST
jgi:hypothetical protein